MQTVTMPRRATLGRAANRSLLSQPLARPVLRPLRFKEEDRPDLLKEADVQRKKVQGNVTNVVDDANRNLAQGLDKVSGSGRAEQLKEFIHTAGGHPEYDQGEPRVPRFFNAFTRRREIFAGRFAMVGIFAACFWEVITPDHKDILSQLTSFFNIAGLNVGNGFSATVLISLIAWNAVSALAPWSETWTEENQQDVQKRVPGPTQGAADATEPKSFLGISGIGFTKRNELFNGRASMVGFFAAIVGQFLQGGLYGPGPLGQVANYLSIPITDEYYSIFPTLALVWVIGLTATAYLSGRPGTLKGENDIY